MTASSPRLPEEATAAGAAAQSTSETGDEFDQPGVNYPDRRDADGAADTPGTGDATREPSTEELQEPSTEKSPGDEPEAPAPPSTEPSHQAVGIGVVEDTQDAPIMAGNDASVHDKIAGIVAQTRQDVGGESEQRIAEVLAQRFADAQIPVEGERLAALAQQVSGR